MFRKFAITFSAVVLCAVCSGQTLSFAEKAWNFGRVQEAGGTVSHKFTFSNTGDKPVVIENVEVSCGCTTTDFSRKPVMPGGEGHVTVVYDPYGRPGPFTKAVTVTANNRSLRATLSVAGDVIEREHPVEELYPVALGGGVRLNMRTLMMRNVAQGEARSTTVGWVNTSSRSVTFALEADPQVPYLKIFAPKTLPPGGRGEITFTIDLSGSKDAYGVFAGTVYPVLDGKRERTGIVMTAYGVDAFGDDPDYDTAPRARFDRQYNDFGEISSRKVTSEFTLANTGQAPLVVRSVECGMGVSVALATGTQIKPGTEAAFEVTLDPAAYPKGSVNERVTIIVNDPLRPVREIRLAANKK